MQSENKGWNLMAMVLATFPPSESLFNYLEGYLRKRSRSDCVLKLHQTRIGGAALFTSEFAQSLAPSLLRELAPPSNFCWWGCIYCAGAVKQAPSQGEVAQMMSPGRTESVVG